MRFAIISLPVPVSPTMSTLLSPSAITWTKSKTVRIRGLRPTTTESSENVDRASSTLRRPPQRECQRGNKANWIVGQERVPRLTTFRHCVKRRRREPGIPPGILGKLGDLCIGHGPCEGDGHHAVCLRLHRPRRAHPSLRPARPTLYVVSDSRRIPRGIHGRWLPPAPDRRRGCHDRAA